MNDLTLLGPWVRRFLLEHLIAERNLARNTQRSLYTTGLMPPSFAVDERAGQQANAISRGC